MQLNNSDLYTGLRNVASRFMLFCKLKSPLITVWSTPLKCLLWTNYNKELIPIKKDMKHKNDFQI